MSDTSLPLPHRCPACDASLVITRLQCPACGTEVTGAYLPDLLAALSEPHAALIELFLRTRGNMKEMERALGLSYPTVRARLEEALTAAGLDRPEVQAARQARQTERRAARAEILDQLERGEITAQEAAARLRDLTARR